jgi:hypothetical protein
MHYIEFERHASALAQLLNSSPLLCCLIVYYLRCQQRTATQTRRLGKHDTESELQITTAVAYLTSPWPHRNGDLFEWYAPFEYIQDTLTLPEMDSKSKVLVMGCGTSGAETTCCRYTAAVTPAAPPLPAPACCSCVGTTSLYDSRVSGPCGRALQALPQPCTTVACKRSPASTIPPRPSRCNPSATRGERA